MQSAENRLKFRIQNYKVNAIMAKQLNPFAFISINTAISILENPESMKDLDDKIDGCKSKLHSLYKRDNDNAVLICRSKWREYVWLVENFK